MMLNRKQELINGASGNWFLVRVAVVLFALLMISGAVTVQAQKMPGAFSSGDWFGSINPHYHTPYYLPYYDGNRVNDDLCLFNNYFFRLRRANPYETGYWYPWSFSWGRYDIPSERWWTFGEGVYDEYGTGGIWTADAPLLVMARKTAVGPLPLQVKPVTRAIKPPPRVARRSGFRSTGTSSSRGSSISSSGGGSSKGSSGGGSSFGSSGGGSFGGSTRGGKK
jgi:uncharacterized membrane protein YgcG